jgi:hypothetical protein
MKLKKAMKLYPIEIKKCFLYTSYILGDRNIFPSLMMLGKWNLSSEPGYRTESGAVAWLIEGAKKLSPMERAMRKWPIKTIGTDNPVYQLGERSVFLSEGLHPGKWMKATKGDETYTEKEAVAYLLEGYNEPKPIEIEFRAPWRTCLVSPIGREFKRQRRQNKKLVV